MVDIRKIAIGKFLLALGVFFLLLEVIPWEEVPSWFEPGALIACGLLLIACYFAGLRVKTVLGRELVKLVAAIPTAAALAVIIGHIIVVSVTPFLWWIPGGSKAKAIEQREFTGDTAGFSKVEIETSIVNGRISLMACKGSEYKFKVIVKASGLTEEDAKEVLKKVNISVVREERNKVLTIKILPKFQKILWARVAIEVINGLDADVEITVEGSFTPSFFYKHSVGSPFTVGAGATDYQTLTDPIPYIRILLKASTAPTSGNVTVMVVRAR